MKKVFFFLLIVFSFHLLAISPIFAAIEKLPEIQDDVVGLCALETLFSNIVQMSAYLVGLAAFVAFLMGSFKYMTSGGDQKATQQAQQTITMAILGIILLVAAWLILSFVKQFTGVDVTKFSIPGCETTPPSKGVTLPFLIQEE